MTKPGDGRGNAVQAEVTRMQLPLIFHSDALALSVSFVCSDLHVIFAFGPTKEAAEKIIVVEGYGL